VNHEVTESHRAIRHSMSSSVNNPAIDLEFDHLFPTRRRSVQSLQIPFEFPGGADISVSQLYCVTTVIDDHGRLSDRSALKWLGWTPGQTVSFDGNNQLVVVRHIQSGRWTVRKNGYLRLPALHRHLCNISSKDRVLITAEPNQDLIVVVPINILTAALSNFLPDVWKHSP